MFIAPKFLMYPALLGAACKLNRHTTWRSAGAQSYEMVKAINMLLLRSTSPRSYHAKTTFRAKPVKLLRAWGSAFLGRTCGSITPSICLCQTGTDISDPGENQKRASRWERWSEMQTRIFTEKTDLNPSSSVRIRGLNQISVMTSSFELSRERSRRCQTGTQQHHRGGLGVLRNRRVVELSHYPESGSTMNRRHAKSAMFPVIVFKRRREQIARVHNTLNINVRQLAESEMLSIIVFKMPHVLIARVQDALNINTGQVVSLGKDKFFKRQITVSPVGPSR